MDLQLVLAFAAACVVISVVPGPDMMLVLAPLPQFRAVVPEMKG